MENIKQIQEKINSLEAKKMEKMKNITSKNEVMLIEEVMNLLDGVGDFYSEDYYAPNRVYSKIDGVKNLRLNNDLDVIIIKVYNSKGLLIPNVLEVRGKKYTIEFLYSKDFNKKVFF